LATSLEQVNIETALLIRQLSPKTRLVVRSAQQNLNELLSEQLGNFIAYEPLELPANAFALAALGSETLGFFELDQQWLRVVQVQLDAKHPWLYNFRLHELHGRTRRILIHKPLRELAWPDFHQWDADSTLQMADYLIYVELLDAWGLHPLHRTQTQALPTLPSTSWLGRSGQWLWQQGQNYGQLLESRPVIALAGCIVVALILLGTLLLHLALPQTSLIAAFYRTVILLLGGYGDLFAEFQEAQANRWLLQPVALLLTLAGTAFVGILYALLTDNLISSKLNFIRKRLPIPSHSHTVVIGLGRVGQRVAQILKSWKQATVGVSFSGTMDARILPEVPIISGSVQEGLSRANLMTASSVVVVTDNDLLNLEVALMAQKQNAQARLVIRTSKEGLSQSLIGLLPRAQVLETYRLAAEVFVGAAFGENILNLFRLQKQTILVTEYQVENKDTLCGLLLGEVAYGYGVIPILYQTTGQNSAFLPSDDSVLKAGDRLVVLGTIEGLKKIEIRDLLPKTWRVRVEASRNQEAAFEGANILSRISGCSLKQARQLTAQLPATLATPLYRPQGQRLVRALRKVQVKASLVPIAEQGGSGSGDKDGKGLGK
jgi:Trk K+ transport system NAD-binding subunit